MVPRLHFHLEVLFCGWMGRVDTSDLGIVNSLRNGFFYFKSILHGGCFGHKHSILY
jgi:hypothetical protein